MTADDPHRRVRTPPDVVEVTDVPLVGTDNETQRASDDGARTQPNWRRSIAVALVGGAIVGIVIAAFVIGSGEGEDVGADGDRDLSGAATTVVDDLAALITTPPTLPPLDTLPPPSEPSSADRRDDGPTDTVARSDAFDQAELPTYVSIDDADLADVVRFDLAAAVARLADDVPRRAETRLELGAGGYVLDVVIERDVERDRYRVALASRGRTQILTVDVPSGRVVIETVDEQVDESIIEFTVDELLNGVGADDANEFFDRMLVGPLRPDSYEPAATEGRGLVVIDDERVAREFVSSVDGDAIPEWQLYALGPVFEFDPADRPSQLDYRAYVDESGDLAQVNGLSAVGGLAQLITHRIVRPPEPITIEFPGRPAPQPFATDRTDS